VKLDEPLCPFCAGALADLPRQVRPAPTARLGRAALFAFGVAAAQGCGDNLVIRAPVDSAVDVSPDALDDGGAVPIYAAAPTPDAGTKQG
jgi:hypothetical protein